MRRATPGDGTSIIELAVAGVVRRSDLLDIDGSVYQVGKPMT
jgi:hypothetical protein